MKEERKTMLESRSDVAILSSFDKYTTFSFGGKKLTLAHVADWKDIQKFSFGITAISLLWLNTNRRRLKMKNI